MRANSYVFLKWPNLTHFTNAQNGQLNSHNSVKNHFHWKFCHGAVSGIYCFHSYHVGHGRATSRWPINVYAQLNTLVGRQAPDCPHSPFKTNSTISHSISQSQSTDSWFNRTCSLCLCQNNVNCYKVNYYNTQISLKEIRNRSKAACLACNTPQQQIAPSFGTIQPSEVTVRHSP